VTAWWWSWALAGIGVAGLYLVTRKDWRGYIVGLAVQVLWVLYAVLTLQWGFIASAIAYGTVNAIGLYRWRFAKRGAPSRDRAAAETGMGLSLAQYATVIAMAQENLPKNSPVSLPDIDAILTAALPAYRDLMGADL
jgi:hypothetical protein